MSEQNEEFATGQRSIEQQQGYLPELPDTSKAEAQAAEDKAINDYIDRTTELNRATVAGEDMPLDLGYNKADGSGRVDERHPVSARKAAEDISRWRQGLAETDAAIKDAALSDEIDRLRGAEAAQPQAPTEPIALDKQVQPEPPPLPPELQGHENDELVKAFQREPALLQAVQTLSWQHDQKVAASAQQALQYGQAVEQQYAQYTQANANIALAAMFSSFPELRGMTVEQINAATPIIERTNPERGAQIRAHVAQVSQLANEARQVQAAQTAQRQQQSLAQFQGWAQQQDDAFEAATKSDPPARQTAIRNEAHRMLREYGMSDQEITYNWQTNPMLRSHAGQMILRDAAQFRLNQRAAQSIKPAPAPAPKVVTPGPSGVRATEQDYDMRALSNRLSETKTIKDAAKLLAAHRARSR
jgi:hypothetical protein